MSVCVLPFCSEGALAGGAGRCAAGQRLARALGEGRRGWAGDRREPREANSPMGRSPQKEEEQEHRANNSEHHIGDGRDDQRVSAELPGTRKPLGQQLACCFLRQRKASIATWQIRLVEQPPFARRTCFERGSSSPIFGPHQGPRLTDRLGITSIRSDAAAHRTAGG